VELVVDARTEELVGPATLPGCAPDDEDDGSIEAAGDGLDDDDDDEEPPPVCTAPPAAPGGNPQHGVASHTLTVLSNEPEARNLPQGEN
ncbi:hypothetical protein HK102_002396, partial [Quaeritorhiza haematococci]